MGALSTHAVDHALALAPFGVTNLNGIIPLLLAVPVATTVFSFRRYRDASQARKELAKLSMLDSLTGLPNRRSLPGWYQRGIARAIEDASHMAVLFVDLDHFKAVNDTHGHDIGDQLLVEVAQRLRSAVRPSDRVVRYGGDEFVILGQRRRHRSGGHEARRARDRGARGAVRVRDAAHRDLRQHRHRGRRRPLRVDGRRAQLGRRGDVRSQGPRHWPLRRGRPRPRAATRPPDAPRQGASDALDAGQFVLHYQPVVAVSDASMVGAEALIRWNHPERGLVFPGEFIQDLEDSGLIVPVGAWVLEEVCRQAREWQDAFPDKLFKVKLNVSASQLAQADFGDVITAALRNTGCAS